MIKISKWLATLLIPFLFIGTMVSAKEYTWDFSDPTDYFKSYNGIEVWGGYASTKLFFTEETNVPENNDQSWGAASADFDGDGDLDIYVANWGQNKLWINVGNNKYEAKDIKGDSGNSQAAIAEDFNKDGFIDIYVVNYNGQNILWLNDGKANFKSFEIPGDGGFSFGAVAKDFNNDGNMDIYVHNADNDNKLWLGGFYTNDKNTPFVNPVNYKYFSKGINSFETKVVSGSVKFQITVSSGDKWYYWDGSEWSETEKIDGTEVSTGEDINQNLTKLISEGGRFKWRAYLDSSSGAQSRISEVKITYDEPNYPPEINLDDEIEINEGVLEVVKVEASDKNQNQTLAYFVGGVDGDLFSIDRSSGQLSFKEAPDFENPKDNNKDNEYELEIFVTDDGGPEETTVKDLKVVVKNLEFSITSYNGDSNVILKVPENTEVISRVEVNNQENLIVSYSLSGIDANLFFINQENGEVKSFNNLDFENPEDGNGDNIYIFRVDIKDMSSNEIVASQNFEIEITDVQENRAPVILTGNQGEELSSNEQEKVVLVVKAEDEDGDVLTFSLGNKYDSDLFLIDSKTGELSFKELPDFENPRDKNRDNIHQVEVIVSDGVLSTGKVLEISINNLGRKTLLVFDDNSNTEVCKDTKAENFSYSGIHNQSLCIYKEDKYNYAPRSKDSYNCPADQILTQNMIIGDRDGKYSGWQKEVINQVKVLQGHINRLGYDLGEPDGDFGPKTFAGVKALQKIFAIDEDGIVGPNFRYKINSSCNFVIDDNNDEEGEPLIEDIEEKYNEEDLNASLERMKWIIQDLINQIRK